MVQDHNRDRVLLNKSGGEEGGNTKGVSDKDGKFFGWRNIGTQQHSSSEFPRFQGSPAKPFLLTPTSCCPLPVGSSRGFPLLGNKPH